MDFALLSTLLPSIAQGITRVLVSYDIGCQWDKKLQTRVSQYSTSATFDLSSLNYWRVVVPKFHLSGHGQNCQLRYNINFTKGAARMCGEGIESGWSQSGSLAIWTRENGPNTRRAILDGHWGECNWQKLLGLRKSFPNLDSQILISSLRRCSAEESPPVSCMGQIPTGGHHLTIPKVSGGINHRMDGHARQV